MTVSIDIRYKGIQHNATQQKDIQHEATKHNDIQFKTLNITHVSSKLVFVPGRPFQPSLIFAGKVLGAKIILGWKGLPRTNMPRDLQHS